MIVAGIGARSVATSADIVAAVTDCCRRAGIALTELGVLAGLDRAETVTALCAAGVELGQTQAMCDHDRVMDDPSSSFAGLKIQVFSVAELQLQASRCVTLSQRSMTATGVPSVAEAAALTASGPDGMLFLQRVAFARVTVALAVAPGGTQE